MCGVPCRWATRGGMLEAAKATGLRGPALNNVLALAHARQKLYRPGGPIARMLARNPTALVVNDTLFAHGGVLPDHGVCVPLVTAHQLLAGSSVCNL